jgi:DNA-binding transcriptional MerR regulator
MTAAAGATGTDSGASLSIGAVLARLRPEFPDLSVSKIRFLESEELVTPDRTASGYRQFSAADVERLRYVLAAQRDHYLPLRIIKDQLDAIDRGLEPATPAPRLPRSLISTDGPQPAAFAASAEVRMTREEVLVEAGLTAEQLTDLEQFGLVSAGRTGYFDADAALTATTLGELLALGLEPRHLRQFRTAADREAVLLAQLVSAQARQRDPDARQRAEEAATGHAATLLRLHALLLRAALRRELNG